jgi:hypothetical protein
MSDDITESILLEVFSGHLNNMLTEWERLVSDKDDVHYHLTKAWEAVGIRRNELNK